MMRNSVPLAALLVALLALPLATPVAHAADAVASPLDALARDTERVESLRAVRNLQYAYSHYAQFGLWEEMGALFASDGETVWGDRTIKGPAAIARYNRDTYGAGKPGLPKGVMNSLFIDVPLSNLSADGNSAAVRWYGLHMRGGGAEARWESGTFENEYVKENGVWKISRLRFFPQFGGLYEAGWRPLTDPLPLVPYHFRNEDIAGTPIPAPVGAPVKTSASLASLEQRIDVLNAEDQARNLQNAYGYYVDRKMWDDVTDLFTSDGVLEIGDVGTWEGPASIRRALERDGPAGLKEGQLNDHPLFDTMIRVSPDGNEAQVRGLELAMLGDYTAGTAHWQVSVFTNRLVRQDGVWKIREMRVYPLMKTDYNEGWGKSRAIDNTGGVLVPAFLPHPVTGRQAAYPRGAKVVADKPLLKPLRTARSATPADGTDARIAEARRRLALSMAYEGATNMTASYTYYIDDGQWTSMGAIFARRGSKQVPFNGYYIGPERIAHRPGATPAVNSTNPGRGGWHWLMQPVIHVAPDGRSAKMRSRLFHPLPSGTGGGLEGGMYPNNQAVLEGGVWKLWSVTIDEPYFTSRFPYGWSRSPPPRPAAPAPAARPATAGPAPRSGAEIYPPDIPLSVLGKRMEGFVGGTGEAIRWPGLLPMWFHYKNPVSGRQPPLYWPNCGTCEHTPDTSMDRHGYLLP